MMRINTTVLCALLALLSLLTAAHSELRGTGDLGIVIERASGSVAIIDTTERSIVARVDGLGDLSHASAVFSPDQRYAFIFGRDGGLTSSTFSPSALSNGSCRAAIRLVARFPMMASWSLCRITSRVA